MLKNFRGEQEFTESVKAQVFLFCSNILRYLACMSLEWLLYNLKRAAAAPSKPSALCSKHEGEGTISDQKSGSFRRVNILSLSLARAEHVATSFSKTRRESKYQSQINKRKPNTCGLISKKKKKKWKTDFTEAVLVTLLTYPSETEILSVLNLTIFKWLILLKPPTHHIYCLLPLCYDKIVDRNHFKEKGFFFHHSSEGVAMGVGSIHCGRRLLP